jgi:hypothetical protein
MSSFALPTNPDIPQKVDTLKNSKHAVRTGNHSDRYQFTRKVKIYEGKVLRNWVDMEKKHKFWKDLPNSEEVILRLWMHEVYALAAWRARDGGKPCSLPPITVSSLSYFLIENIY